MISFPPDFNLGLTGLVLCLAGDEVSRKGCEGGDDPVEHILRELIHEEYCEGDGRPPKDDPALALWQGRWRR